MFSSTDKIHGTYNLLVIQLLENSRWCKLNPRNDYTLRTIKAVITVCFAAAVNNSSCHLASLKKRNAVDHLIKCPISLDLCLPSQQGKLPFSPMMSRFTINTIAFQSLVSCLPTCQRDGCHIWDNKWWLQSLLSTKCARLGWIASKYSFIMALGVKWMTLCESQKDSDSVLTTHRECMCMVWSSFIGCLTSGDIHNLYLIQNSNYLTNKSYQKVVPHIRKTWGVRIVWEIYFKDEKVNQAYTL